MMLPDQDAQFFKFYINAVRSTMHCYLNTGQGQEVAAFTCSSSELKRLYMYIYMYINGYEWPDVDE